jgi:hypothetical protein
MSESSKLYSEIAQHAIKLRTAVVTYHQPPGG